VVSTRVALSARSLITSKATRPDLRERQIADVVQNDQIRNDANVPAPDPAGYGAAFRPSFMPILEALCRIGAVGTAAVLAASFSLPSRKLPRIGADTFSIGAGKRTA
jgi:hypothetical protein